MRPLVLLLLFCSTFAFAQKDQHNWYFGRYAAISFESGTGQVRYDNPQNVYGRTASISDAGSGKLKLYTNGSSLWNGSHGLLRNGNIPSASPANDVLIVPFPGDTGKYYVFFIGTAATLEYVVADMSLHNGEGEVIRGPGVVSSGNLPQLAVIRHLYADAFWVITHEKNNSRFRCHYVDASGVSLQPVVSDAGLNAATLGDMCGSNRGHKLAVTHFYSNDFKAEVLDFDRVCGTISSPVELGKQAEWDHAYGIAFSPDDTKLYITYGVAQSYLVQYSGPGYANRYLVASSTENFNIMRLGPDQRIYMATHDNGIPGERINVILNPNGTGASCAFSETHLRLDEGAGKKRVAQFELPAFASGRKLQSPLRDSVFSYSGSCAGDTVAFLFDTGNPFDSLSWEFGDGTAGSTLTNPLHRYSKGGRYLVSLTIYRCSRGYTLSDSVSIDSFPPAGLPSDTIVCAGSGVRLIASHAEAYLWSTGEATQAIVQHDTGITWLRASNGHCTTADTVLISNHPDIITALGPEYFICEDDEELAKLDAGEGFTAYRWLPTNDTTQWIIVKNTGDYFVKVTDHHGCHGNGDTKVKRRCGITLFFPNTFTPDNDGLNDHYLPAGNDVVSFRMNIYNAWGERVFSCNDHTMGWDGTFKGLPAPAGVYIYEAEYTGYRNKRLQHFSRKGNITLMR